MRILELFCGIGGWRYASEGLGAVVAAYDISPPACETYALNHGERPHARELATLQAQALLRHGADTWMMSPPCQPFCRMGHQKGLEDPRSRAFLNLLGILEMCPPRRLVLENVVGFLGSEAQVRLCELLDRQGFQHRSFELCPTRFGVPNQRPRYYVVASQEGLGDTALPTPSPIQPLAGFLDPEEDTTLYLSPELLAKHGGGMDFVSAQEFRSTCFIGGYGERFVGSGSFLRTDRGVRRFSPREIANLMGLPSTFSFPAQVPRTQQYKLVGNGLSIPAARWIVRQVMKEAEMLE